MNCVFFAKMDQIFSLKKNQNIKKYWKMGGGGILEKSRNFDSPEKWEPHKYNGESYYVLASYLIGGRKIQKKFCWRPYFVTTKFVWPYWTGSRKFREKHNGISDSSHKNLNPLGHELRIFKASL